MRRVFGSCQRMTSREFMRPFRPDAKCPLDGIRVLDLSRLVAGNMLSLQLADFGAEVIKIEDPRKGDPLRDWRIDGISVHWKVYARNKKSVTLNLRAPRRPATCCASSSRPRRCSSRTSAPARSKRWASARTRCIARNPQADHRARVGLGTGRALSRQARLRQPGRGHVGLCGEERLCRPPAGAAAARARRHDRRASTARSPCWSRCARSSRAAARAR